VIRAEDIDSEKITEYAHTLSGRIDMPADILEMMLTEPLNYAAAMVAVGDADGMVAGLACATQDVIMSSQMLIGLADSISLPSSFFIMELDNPDIGEEGCLVFADCAVVPQPTADELADIAISTADSVRRLLGWVPRVAMISFSSQGSAVHDDVKKVQEALAKVRGNRADLSVDGEFQVDTAIVASVAASKVKGTSAVAGKANILIFPDLDAGNAGYKLVQRLAGANAYGPVLQGFQKPISDLSRGATVDDIVGAAILTAAQVEE
jgi:phosphate acetyltransferase